MSQASRSRRRKGAATHGRARPAKRWASAARRASRSVAARRPDRARAVVRPIVKPIARRAKTQHAKSQQSRSPQSRLPHARAAGAKRRVPRPKRRLRSPDVRAVSGIPFELMEWIRRRMSGDLGPVANKEVFRHSDFIFQIIKGPNRRNDFHLDPYDEIFYQLKGTVWVHLIGENGKERVAELREGGVLLVSAFTPHSARRPPDSIGLVVERPRTARELDGVAWYCEGCGLKLHETWLPCEDIEVQLKAALEAFNADLARRTCRRCGAVLPDPAEHPPWRKHLEARRH
jgi:3-hydroxyanthranilate 3,4-dioxygenase